MPSFDGCNSASEGGAAMAEDGWRWKTEMEIEMGVFHHTIGVITRVQNLIGKSPCDCLLWPSIVLYCSVLVTDNPEIHAAAHSPEAGSASVIKTVRQYNSQNRSIRYIITNHPSAQVPRPVPSAVSPWPPRLPTSQTCPRPSLCPRHARRFV